MPEWVSREWVSGAKRVTTAPENHNSHSMGKYCKYEQRGWVGERARVSAIIMRVGEMKKCVGALSM